MELRCEENRQPYTKIHTPKRNGITSITTATVPSTYTTGKRLQSGPS